VEEGSLLIAKAFQGHQDAIQNEEVLPRVELEGMAQWMTLEGMTEES
jgi:hypothetical protein